MSVVLSNQDGYAVSSTGDRLIQSVEPFRGSSQELADFICGVWQRDYARRMAFPIWSRDFFDWQLSFGDGQPDRRLAVYDKDRLAAVLIGFPMSVRADSRTFKGANWSWLSVAQEYRGFGLAKLLDAARVEVERDAESDLIVSYRFNGSKHSLAERPSSQTTLKRFHCRLGLWARPLDGKRLQRWNVSAAEGILGRMWTPVLPKPENSNQVRSYEVEDLPSCLEITQRQFKGFGISVDWTPTSLQHQLAGHSMAQTIVAEEGGEVRGFINFHVLPFQGKTRELVGVIDLICVGQLSYGRRSKLMSCALRSMQDQGAILALKLRSGDVGRSFMLRIGFTPRLPDSSLVLQWTQHPRTVPGNKPTHLLWR